MKAEMTVVTYDDAYQIQNVTDYEVGKLFVFVRFEVDGHKAAKWIPTHSVKLISFVEVPTIQ